MTDHFKAHPDRSVALAEVHARPFHPISSPSRIVLFAFMTDTAQAMADRAAFAAFCHANHVEPPLGHAKHHRLKIRDFSVKWEQHSEFTTYTWELPSPSTEPFTLSSGTRAELMRALPQPGPHLVSVDLHFVPHHDSLKPEDYFAPAGTVMSSVESGAAIVATDFVSDDEGFIRLLVVNKSLTPARAGGLVQRLLEIETYRMLSLLGLPEALRTAPAVKTIEDALVRIAREMTATDGVANDQLLLDELTALAARLEADSAISGYRFGASRAYDSIVQQRLTAIGEQPIPGWSTLAAFLQRRVAPAMRTCQMLEERQANLSRKLTRAANLLRTRVDVEIEQQNQALLGSMDARAQMQLRLQQTVEGLSIAAISYYVVGLATYVIKGAKEANLFPFELSTATAIIVPVTIIAVAMIVRRIRNRSSHS